jgi:class 3 adenylate cyclase
MLIYLKTTNYDFFRISQLGLFLFLPFVAQWAAGNFITTSGVILWGLFAPVGALLCMGASESVGWFIAWVALTAFSGITDYYLLDPMLVSKRPPDLRTSVAFFALNFIMVSSVLYVLLRYALLEKRAIQTKLEEAHAQIQTEQARAEKLLLNVLPRSVADRLKSSNQTIADGFAEVTVMFADIVNFTQIAADLSPEHVFSMLNRVFSAFDELAEKYGLEKIKTIGDAYMVAGGLDNRRADYVHAIIEMAIDMRDLVRRDAVVNPSHLEVRIGIGTGPVIAGVVGKNKFIYDIWGNTVNLASRITSESEPGMIQCDAATYQRVANAFSFHEPRTIHLKGKGDTPVYCLAGRKNSTSLPYV